MAVSQYLKAIYDRKREELDALKTACPLDEIRARAADAAPCRDFLAALKPTRTEVHLIAELKKASPSKGLIRPDFNPTQIAKDYVDNGASALSVLTEQYYFLGDPDTVAVVKQAGRVPVLRKDFLFDPWHVYESRAIGADAIMLIVGMLDDGVIRDLVGLAGECGMAVMIEVHTEEELARVPKDARLVGVNNRDLETFKVDLEVGRYLVPLAEVHGPPDRIVVAESGVLTRQDVLLMHDAGADAILVGEFLMRRPDVGAAVRELLGLSY